MKIYFYTWNTYYREQDWGEGDDLRGTRIETFTTAEASLNAYKKHKRKIDKLNSSQDKKNEEGDFTTVQRWDITEPRGIEVKGYQELKQLCKHLVDRGEMEYGQEL